MSRADSIGPNDIPKVQTSKSEAPKQPTNIPIERVEVNDPLHSNDKQTLGQTVLEFFANRVKAGKTSKKVANLAIAKLQAGSMDYNPSGGDNTPIAGA